MVDNITCGYSLNLLKGDFPNSGVHPYHVLADAVEYKLIVPEPPES